MSKASRKYEAGVERALGLFDATNEWADYIAFLSRLHRALQGGPDGADIPCKQTVAKDLAQCLTPALPSGVHQKALEVYASIFSIIGKNRLAKDLALYLPGLSHTLSFGSLSVRPLFLLLIRDHVLRLPPPALRPALKAILLSLLPGLEDESTDDFETTLATVSETRIIFAREGHEGFFWQSLFLVTITSPNRRSGAFVYLTRHLPKLRFQKSAVPTHAIGNVFEEDPLNLILSPEPGLLIRCFAAGLLDEQLLVQRNFLDLLVTHLPIGALTETNRVVAKDIEILVSAAVSVVLRRDMSLNKRLWSWFLGSEAQDQSENGNNALSLGEQTSSTQRANGEVPTNGNETYFQRYSLAPLTQSLQSMIDLAPKIPSERARPYRIALSLMDRWEVGGPVVAATFVPLMRSLQDFHGAAASEEAYAEVFRSANVFFDGVESNLIWTQMFQLYERDQWDLIGFLISRFNLEEEEMLLTHLPLFVILLCHKLAINNGNLDALPVAAAFSSQPDAQMKQIQTILAVLVNLVPERAYGSRDDGRSRTDNGEATDTKSIVAFYSSQGNGGSAPVPTFPREMLTSLSLRAATDTYIQYLASRSLLIYDFAQAFAVLISKIPSKEVLRNLDLLQSMEQHLPAGGDTGPRWLHLSASSIASVLVAMSPQHRVTSACHPPGRRLVFLLTARFWELLSTSSPQFHVEAVQHIINLHGISDHSRGVESTVVSLLLASETPAEHRIDRFSVLWNLAGKASSTTFMRKPLTCVLDMSLSQSPCEAAKMWIRGLPFASLEIIYQIILEKDQQECITRALGLATLQSEEQWLALTAEEGAHIRQTLSSKLFQALKLAPGNTLSVEFEHTNRLEVLTLLRTMHNHGALSTDNITVINSLVELLRDSPEGSLLRRSLIETLQELTAGRSAPYGIEVLSMLLKGIASTVDDSIDQWMSLTCAVVMLYNESIFQVLLKVTACFCNRLDSCLTTLQNLFDTPEQVIVRNPEKLTVNLLGGVEYVLARAHQRLGERARQKHSKSPDQPQGLFGGKTLTSSSSVAEEKQIGSSFANDRLTVILCFQDAVKLCYRYWSWGTSSHTSTAGTQASLHHIASKVRSRSRRILDNLLDAEPQESLETLIGVWVDAIRKGTQIDGKPVLDLLQSLKGGRPRLTLPTTFNAIYNRTNPAALDRNQKSTLSTDVSAMELASFLTEYTTSLEDDLMEEIWVDCTTFLREILANPMPHRQILLHLLEFVAILCSKIENTNFGEGYKMRKELGDICLRLFTAIFTVKSGGLETVPQTLDNSPAFNSTSLFDARNLLQVLHRTLPSLSHVLTESDRFATVLIGIVNNVTGPLLRAKTFPQNISLDLLVLLQLMAKPVNSNKSWRKDVFDVFNDARFFNSPASLVRPGWLPLIRQMLLADKSLLPNLLTQLVGPTTAGLMFGVGATAARTEADKRTQAVLRRTALLYVAADADAFSGSVGQVHAKVEQLLMTTKESSPSSMVRGDLYMLLRAIVLTTSPLHLALLWPTIDADLRDVFSSLAEKDASTKYPAGARLQAAKLLDVLLLLRPDEFQIHEWLFVTDTVDAIYPPPDFVPSSLSDVIARTTPGADEYPLPTTLARRLRQPWLCSEMSREVSEDDIDSLLLLPFFRQLSIHAFEDVYSLRTVDTEACVDDLIADLFYP